MTYATTDEALKALQGPDGIDCPQCGRVFRRACDERKKAALRYVKVMKERGGPWKMGINSTDLLKKISKMPGGLKHFDVGFSVDAAVSLDKCLRCREMENE